MKTRVLRVPVGAGDGEGAPPLGHWAKTKDSLEEWCVPESTVPPALLEAAAALRDTDVPVAFPTETVYGLGADATRSAAVRGIYAAKGRPSDNPLIVHVADLTMLRALLSSSSSSSEQGEGERDEEDMIPEIYRPLIDRFWPGPLTILLPNLGKSGSSSSSRLAPEVTATLATFGARMPASALARTLIKLSGAPLAAPSANASTRPSPTTAQHVLDDLAGRIELIVDGGPCAVGVESTVVDGLCEPPAVLRPGGVSIEQLRACPGWEGVVRAYRDGAEESPAAPRAPGMKYKHYSPRARVVLVEKGARVGPLDGHGGGGTVGVIRTGGWPAGAGWQGYRVENLGAQVVGEGVAVREGRLVDGKQESVRLLDVDLGGDVKAVAHGLFAALRELDRLGAGVIYVEGVDDSQDIAAAVMNRLRKAASEIRT